ncbi:MAG: AraC family transcriptional regulator [Kiritimatiellae bacterium]|nr:AraC family transcriptional regulator [Kiritimatiellia bacterium]
MKNILIDPANNRKIVDFRRRGFKDVLALGRYSYAQAHAPLKEHTHGDMFEICYLEEGAQSYEVEGESFTLKGGDIFVTFPHEAHGSGGTPLNRGRLYWMLIAVPAKRERFLNLPPGEGQELVSRLLSIPSRHFKGGAQLKTLLEQILKVHDECGSGLQSANIKNWMLRFLLDVLELAELHGRNAISPAIAGVLRYIEGHVEEVPPPMAELALMANLSVSRFKARFKEESGMSPGSYINLQKIELAKKYLKEGALSITEIAYQLGFSSSQYFATVFKRHTTMQPLEWRARG